MRRAVLCLAFGLFAPSALAQDSAFHAGTAIPEFGKVASVDTDMPIPPGTEFHIRYDIAKGAEPGEISRSLNTLARFINMHVENGVAPEDIHLAAIIHGPATLDMVADERYQAERGAPNANAPLIATLAEAGVKFIVCGQSAAASHVEKAELLPGVELALSAMTAHALLDAEGYVLNPF